MYGIILAPSQSVKAGLVTTSGLARPLKCSQYLLRRRGGRVGVPYGRLGKSDGVCNTLIETCYLLRGAAITGTSSYNKDIGDISLKKPAEGRSWKGICHARREQKKARISCHGEDGRERESVCV